VGVAERASFQQTGAPATLVDGADRTQHKVTVGAHSEEAVPDRRAPSAIEALAAWEEAGSVVAEAAGEVVVAAEGSRTKCRKEREQCDTNHSSQY